MTFMRSSTAGGRLLIAACLAATLLVPVAGVSLAAPLSQTPTGTLLGTVTCGPDEDTPAAQARILIEGVDLATRADASGKFTLVDVPTAQLLTVDALADPQGAVLASRYDVSVQPGQTLDIGNLDLAVCPARAVVDTTVQDQPQTDNLASPYD